MRVLLTVVALLMTACVGDTPEVDKAYADRVFAEGLRKGMPFTEVKAFFAKHGDDISLFEECDRKEPRTPPCWKTAIGVIPLPEDNWWLGKGTAQIYLDFSNAETLDSYFYEIYYPREH